MLGDCFGRDLAVNTLLKNKMRDRMIKMPPLTCRIKPTEMRSAKGPKKTMDRGITLPENMVITPNTRPTYASSAVSCK